MKNKKGLIFGLVALGLLGFFGYPHMQWFRFTMIIRDEMDGNHLGRFPKAEKLIDFRELLTTNAKKCGFDPIKVELELELRDVGNISFLYFKIRVYSESHSFKLERRIESDFTNADNEAMQDNDIKIPDQ